MISSKEILQQIPVRVRWAGWESRTDILRREGWQVFVDERMSMSHDGHQISMALKAPDNRLMIHGDILINGRELRMHYPNSSHSFAERLLGAGIDMQSYRHTDRVHVYEKPGYAWSTMDAMLPCDGFATLHKEFNFGDLKLFSYKETSKEIYIPMKSVDQCLDRILELQYPAAQEFKEKQKGLIEKPIIQAKIYALAA